MCVAAIGIIGGVVSAIGSLYAGQAQANAYKAEAKMQEYQAQSLSNAGAFESARKGQENERLTGSQVTAIAASGGDLSGSGLDVIKDSRTEGEMDKALIRANMQQKSDMSRYQASISKMNAKAAKTGSMISAGAGLINSFAGAMG